LKPAVSNIALPAYEHEYELQGLSDIGFSGLEVATSRAWRESDKVTFSQVEAYRRQVENAGLKIIGLHSLFFDQPDLGLFRGKEIRETTLQFLTHLSKVCADLGGKSLVYGSPRARKRGELSIEAADNEAISFFGELSQKIDSHGTCFVIEALGENETDYINSARHALKITHAVNKSSLQSHLDAKAVIDADEGTLEVFMQMAPTLMHFHANDPGLGVLGETGEVDHTWLGKLLRKIKYDGYVSVEQRMVDKDHPLRPVKKSFTILKQCYLQF
jgi:sugar phosphate isomerase/epimerase